MKTLLASIGTLFLVGCGAGMVLKSPVQTKCEDAGLRGCPDITDGVILYVEGDQGRGAKKILAGASQNAPDQLKQFAAAIRELKSVPGASNYMEPLLKIAELLTSAPTGVSPREVASTTKISRPSSGSKESDDDVKEPVQKKKPGPLVSITAENGGSSARVSAGGEAAFTLRLDGSVEKITISGLRVDLCKRHGSWTLKL